MLSASDRIKPQEAKKLQVLFVTVETSLIIGGCKKVTQLVSYSLTR